MQWGDNMARRRLIAERVKRGLTQARVAKNLGITQGTVAALEGGVRHPSRQMMQRFAEFYGVTVDELFFASESEEEQATVLDHAVGDDA